MAGEKLLKWKKRRSSLSKDSIKLINNSILNWLIRKTKTTVKLVVALNNAKAVKKKIIYRKSI